MIQQGGGQKKTDKFLLLGKTTYTRYSRKEEKQKKGDPQEAKDNQTNPCIVSLKEVL